MAAWHDQRRCSRQVSRNLGGFRGRRGREGSGAEKRKAQSTSFPQPRAFCLGGGGGRGRRQQSTSFPQSRALSLRQVSRNLGSLVWEREGEGGKSFPQPPRGKAQVDKFPATSGLKFGGRKKEAQSTSFPQPRVFSSRGKGAGQKKAQSTSFPQPPVFSLRDGGAGKKKRWSTSFPQPRVFSLGGAAQRRGRHGRQVSRSSGL